MKTVGLTFPAKDEKPKTPEIEPEKAEKLKESKEK